MADQESPLRKLEAELYSGAPNEPEERSRLHRTAARASSSWGNTSAPKPSSSSSMKLPSSWYKKFFVGAVLFCVVALLFAVVTFIRGGNNVSSKLVTVNVLGKTFADGGEELPLQIEIGNKNATSLELAKLVVEYPLGSATDPNAKGRIERTIGTIKAGEQKIEDINLQLFGAEGTQQAVTARLEYRVSGSNAIFEQQGSLVIALRSSPLRIAVAAPETTIPNQEITYTVTVTSNATEVLPRILLSAQYPEGFKVTKLEPEALAQDSIWDLGDLTPGSTRDIKITGTMKGVRGEEKIVRFAIGAGASKGREIATVYQTLAQQTTLADAFLDAALVINDQDQEELSVGAGTQLTGKVEWKNTLPVAITNGEISVSLSGTAYEKQGVSVQQGFFDSAQNRIVWSSAQVPALSRIDPGESGTLTFGIVPRPLSGSGGVISAPTMILSTTVKGVQEGGTPLSGAGIDQATVKFSSDVRIDTKTLHSTGPIQNTGPIPPRAEQATTYTLVWTVSNTSNQIRDAVVKATLPTYVTWKGAVSPQGSSVSYNSVTREVSWQIGDLDRGIGFAGAPAKEIAFQISATPSSAQIGNLIDLSSRLTLEGVDGFTNLPVSAARAQHTTGLTGEGTNGRVAP